MKETYKYVHIDWNGWDTTASMIEDDKELHLWLQDGSLKENDIVIEVKRKYKVMKKINDTLYIQKVPMKLPI